MDLHILRLAVHFLAGGALIVLAIVAPVLGWAPNRLRTLGLAAAGAAILITAFGPGLFIA